MSTIVIEHAKSGHSQCHGECHGEIPEGHLRIGKRGETGFIHWRCFPECLSETVAVHMYDFINSFDEIEGWDELSPHEQHQVQHAFERLVHVKE